MGGTGSNGVSCNLADLVWNARKQPLAAISLRVVEIGAGVEIGNGSCRITRRGNVSFEFSLASAEQNHTSFKV